MTTLVCFHAHPDDESITTGGTIARAVAEGHRAVLVVATRGECGEVPEDLAEDETLADRRVAETMRSAAVLGISRVEFLGYTDSGMDGWDQNNEPASFWQAPVDAAAERLATILREESADVLTVYDPHGNYGHPDHVQVHRVGHRAAELAGTPVVYEATMNRDAVKRMVDMAAELAPDMDFDPPEMPEDMEFGMPEADLTTAVDVSPYVAQKRESITMHASQVTDSTFFLRMPPAMFAQRVLDRVVHPQGRAERHPRRQARRLVSRLILVRHGRAAGGWDDDLDPGLDELGRAQAEAMADLVAPRGPLPILVSPMRRCRETAQPLERRWQATATVDAEVGEIPSPPSVAMEQRTAWLRNAMAGTWADVGADYSAWRDSVVARLRAIDEDTVVVSHFVAINAAIGAALGTDQIVIAALDNCSQTVIDVVDGRLVLVEQGFEAPDTLVR